MEDIYNQFIKGLYTDVVFKGFYQTYDANSYESKTSNGTSQQQVDKDSNNLFNSSSYNSNSDEEMRDQNSSI